MNRQLPEYFFGLLNIFYYVSRLPFFWARFKSDLADLCIVSRMFMMSPIMGRASRFVGKVSEAVNSIDEKSLVCSIEEEVGKNSSTNRSPIS